MKLLLIALLIIATPALCDLTSKVNNACAQFWGRLDQCLLLGGDCDCLTELVEETTTEDVVWEDPTTGSVQEGQTALAAFFCGLASTKVDYEYHISNTGFVCRKGLRRAMAVLQQLDQVHSSFFTVDNSTTYSQITTTKYMTLKREALGDWKIERIVSQFVQVIPDIANPSVVLAGFPFVPFDYEECEVA